MKTSMSFTFVALLVAATPARADNPVDVRLNAVDLAVRACRYIYASQPDATEKFYQSSVGSMAHNCECAAMLTVSPVPDEQLLTLTPDSARARAALLRANMARCAVGFPGH